MMDSFFFFQLDDYVHHISMYSELKTSLLISKDLKSKIIRAN